MTKQQSKESTNRFGVQRPTRDRVFYANAVNVAFNQEQEAIFDFKLVMPEDFTMVAEPRTEPEDEELKQGPVSVDLQQVPVEVRVYMPINQFLGACARMARLWERVNASVENEPRVGESQPRTESEVVQDG